MKYLTILGLLFSLSTFAVTPVKQGDPAPGQGYYITPDEEKGFRKLNEENITLKDLSVHQDEKAQLLEDRVKNYQQYVDEQKKLGPWEKTGYIVLGVVGTTALLFLATSVVKSAGK